MMLKPPTLIAGDLLMGQASQFVDFGHCKEVYTSLHKRVHAIKFQSVVAPNGLIANLYGQLKGGTMTVVC